MDCPKCGKKSKVIHSRAMKEEGGIKRRRECVGCKHRWTTYQGGDKSEYIKVDVPTRQNNTTRTSTYQEYGESATEFRQRCLKHIASHRCFI